MGAAGCGNVTCDINTSEIWFNGIYSDLMGFIVT